MVLKSGEFICNTSDVGTHEKDFPLFFIPLTYQSERAVPQEVAAHTSVAMTEAYSPSFRKLHGFCDMVIFPEAQLLLKQLTL